MTPNRSIFPMPLSVAALFERCLIIQELKRAPRVSCSGQVPAKALRRATARCSSRRLDCSPLLMVPKRPSKYRLFRRCRRGADAYNSR